MYEKHVLIFLPANKVRVWSFLVFGTICHPNNRKITQNQTFVAVSCSGSSSKSLGARIAITKITEWKYVLKMLIFNTQNVNCFNETLAGTDIV